jgi:DNA-binding MarR family transcriptional regulator
MSTLSEAEMIAQHQLDQVLEALPAIRRWLVRATPMRPNPDLPPLHLSQLRVLVHLYLHGQQTIGEIARGLGISSSTASECIDGLASRGIIVRTRSETDRRQVLVTMTPSAIEMGAKIMTARQEVVERAMNELNLAERAAFVKGFLLLTRYAESWIEHQGEAGEPVAAGGARKEIADG